MILISIYFPSVCQEKEGSGCPVLVKIYNIKTYWLLAIALISDIHFSPYFHIVTSLPIIKKRLHNEMTTQWKPTSGSVRFPKINTFHSCKHLWFTCSASFVTIKPITVLMITYLMPCWKSEFLLVLQMIRSAHWTTTMLEKKAVWQVNSMIFLCSYVCKVGKAGFICFYMKIPTFIKPCWRLCALAPYPLLPIAVLQVIEFTVIPVDADAQQVFWEEAVFSQDHKVGEKSGQSLHHT